MDLIMDRMICEFWALDNGIVIAGGCYLDVM